MHFGSLDDKAGEKAFELFTFFGIAQPGIVPADVPRVRASNLPGLRVDYDAPA